MKELFYHLSKLMPKALFTCYQLLKKSLYNNVSIIRNTNT